MRRTVQIRKSVDYWLHFGNGFFTGRLPLTTWQVGVWVTDKYRIAASVSTAFTQLLNKAGSVIGKQKEDVSKIYPAVASRNTLGL